MVGLPVYLPDYISVCLSAHLFVYILVCSRLYVPVCVCLFIFSCLFVWQSVCLYLSVSVCQLVCRSVCLCIVYLSIPLHTFPLHILPSNPSHPLDSSFTIFTSFLSLFHILPSLTFFLRILHILLSQSSHSTHPFSSLSILAYILKYIYLSIAICISIVLRICSSIYVVWQRGVIYGQTFYFVLYICKH